MAKSASERINWVEGSITETFGLKRIYENFPLLNEWLKVENNLTPLEISELEKRRSILIRKYSSWNEETLKMKFVAFILDMVGYDTNEFEGVFDLELKGIVQNEKLSVIADYVVAKVIFSLVKQPYFYFHEYKQSKKNKDPIDQILLAMLIAQEKNEKKFPLYGCAVIAEQWFFMILDGKHYSVSIGHNALDPKDLQEILLILRKFKHILLTELAI